MTLARGRCLRRPDLRLVSGACRTGQQVIVASTTLAEPPVRAVHRAVLQRDAWPLLRLTPAGAGEDFYRHATERHLDGFAPIELLDMQSADASVAIMAPANTRALAGVDPALIARAGAARRTVQEARLARRWCGTLWPTPALAQQAGMSLDDYAHFVGRRAVPGPGRSGAGLAGAQRAPGRSSWSGSARRARSASRRREPTCAARRGTHLDQLRRPAQHAQRRGVHRAARALGHRDDPFRRALEPRGVEVAGIELEFREGEVVRARAQRGEEYLRRRWPPMRARAISGELGIGTNAGIDRATGSILFDEKMAGTVHLAVGRSYPETGGQNDSALHWDMICDLRTGAGSARTARHSHLYGELQIRDAPHQDRRHHRTGLPRSRDPGPHDRGGRRRLSAQLLPRRSRDACPERPVGARGSRPGRPPGGDPPGPARAQAPHRRAARRHRRAQARRAPRAALRLDRAGRGATACR